MKGKEKKQKVGKATMKVHEFLDNQKVAAF